MAHFIPAQFLTERDFQEHAHNLIERILLFADLLRKNRVPVHTAKVLDAIAALQILPGGVYIAMNGRIFDPQRARKNLEMERFEEL